MRFPGFFVFNGLGPLKMAAHPCVALVPAVHGRALIYEDLLDLRDILCHPFDINELDIALQADF